MCSSLTISLVDPLRSNDRWCLDPTFMTHPLISPTHATTTTHAFTRVPPCRPRRAATRSSADGPDVGRPLRQGAGSFKGCKISMTVTRQILSLSVFRIGSNQLVDLFFSCLFPTSFLYRPKFPFLFRHNTTTASCRVKRRLDREIEVVKRCKTCQ